MSDDTEDGTRPYELRVHETPEEAVEALAEHFVRTVAEAIEARRRARIALAGGSTPKRLYALLATDAWRERVDWSRVHVFFGDERCVPLDAPESNHAMARAALLKHVPVPAEQVHPVDTSRPPYDAAAAYADTLGRAALDLVLLGIGDDGHTASLFPGGPELTGLKSGAVVATQSPIPPNDRVSLSLETLRGARGVAFLVLGAAKAPALADVLAELDGPDEKLTLPAAMVRPANHVPLWFVDRAAVGGRT